MIKFLYRINAAYDRIREPKRFLVFFIPAVAFILMLSVPNKVIITIGITGLFIMAIVRVGYLDGLFNAGKPPTTVPISKGKDIG